MKALLKQVRYHRRLMGR